MIKNLNEYKDLKKSEEEYKELLIIKNKLNNCIDALKTHSKYVFIMESLSILHNSRTLVEIKINQRENYVKKD